jgi:hypothetical protein
MIEPTDEMRMVAYRDAREWAAAHGHQQPDDRMIDDVLVAVLAVVERDYHVTLRADMPYKGWLIEHVDFHDGAPVEGCTFCKQDPS